MEDFCCSWFDLSSFSNAKSSSKKLYEHCLCCFISARVGIEVREFCVQVEVYSALCRAGEKNKGIRNKRRKNMTSLEIR